MTQNATSKKDVTKTKEFKELTALLAQEAETTGDLLGKDGLLPKLFAKTIESMLEAEITNHLGYAKHERNKNTNARNGKYNKNLKTSSGVKTIEIPRDRTGDFEPKIVGKYETNTTELENKIIAMYASTSVRDIQANLVEMYGIEVSSSLITTVTDKILPKVEEWQMRPLENIYPFVFLDAVHIKMRVDGKVKNCAVYIGIGVNLEGKKDILGMWVSTGGESSNYWLDICTELNERGVKDIFIVSIDGLSGFKDAIQSVFPDTLVQRCVIHQIRACLKYVTWKDKKEFMKDLKLVYKATNEKEALVSLDKLEDKWGSKYKMAVKSWRDNWTDLATYFDFPQEIRRVIYTTNTVESFNRNLRKSLKIRSVFPTQNAAMKVLYLAMRNTTKKWTMSIQNWPKILNQLAIKFEGRFN